MIFCDLGFEKVAHPKGLKPPTLAFEARCSIQLSYGCKKKRKENINWPRSAVKEKAPIFLDSKKWGDKKTYLEEEPFACSSLNLAASFS